MEEKSTLLIQGNCTDFKLALCTHVCMCIWTRMSLEIFWDILGHESRKFNSSCSAKLWYSKRSFSLQNISENLIVGGEGSGLRITSKRVWTIWFLRDMLLSSFHVHFPQQKIKVKGQIKVMYLFMEFKAVNILRTYLSRKFGLGVYMSLDCKWKSFFLWKYGMFVISFTQLTFCISKAFDDILKTLLTGKSHIYVHLIYWWFTKCILGSL